jgi:nitrate reductase gamma subunit
MSDLLHFAQHRLQEGALIFMAVVYGVRVYWLTRFKMARERQAHTGSPDTNAQKGVGYSMVNIALPWAMESTRSKPFFYAQFVLFHLGVTAAITLSFVIPYLPSFLDHAWVVRTFQAFIGAAFVVGCVRIVRRLTDKTIRAISTPDDYFSLILLTVWFASGVFAAPNSAENGEWVLLAFFFLTAFFLVYVPFSKISHYLYYPFGRFFVGRTFGHRGVFPLPKSPKPQPSAR